MPGVTKAVAATTWCIKRSVKEEDATDNIEPLGDDPVIINDKEEKIRPLIVPDKSKGSGAKKLKVDIEMLTFKPVIKSESRAGRARRNLCMSEDSEEKSSTKDEKESTKEEKDSTQQEKDYTVIKAGSRIQKAI